MDDVGSRVVIGELRGCSMKQGRPVTVFVEYKGKRLSLRQLAKATGHKVATIEDRYHRYKARGPHLWRPSERPRTHVC